MPKRRRERDRPKAKHNALYRPDERVLLSYDTDDEPDSLNLNKQPNLTSQDDGNAAIMYEADMLAEKSLNATTSADVRNDTDRELIKSTKQDAACDVKVVRIDQMDDLLGDGGRNVAVQQDDASITAAGKKPVKISPFTGKPMQRRRTPGQRRRKRMLQQKKKDEKQRIQAAIEAEQEMQANAAGLLPRDDVTGQRPMFGVARMKRDELDANIDDEEEEVEDVSAAMAYLNSVRAERADIPELLTSHDKHIQDNYMFDDYDEAESEDEYDADTIDHDRQHTQDDYYGDDMDEDDEEGTYFDGIYAAKPGIFPTYQPVEDEYMQSLVSGFRSVRELLHQPQDQQEYNYALAAPEHYMIDTVPIENKSFWHCTKLVGMTTPSIYQMQGVESSTAWDLLNRVIRRMCLIKSQPIAENIGWWVYYLLARLREPLDSDEIFELRALVRQVAHVRDAVSDDLTTATIVDTLLVVIGAHFGQRDLLGYRRAMPAARSTSITDESQT